MQEICYWHPPLWYQIWILPMQINSSNICVTKCLRTNQWIYNGNYKAKSNKFNMEIIKIGNKKPGWELGNNNNKKIRKKMALNINTWMNHVRIFNFEGASCWDCEGRKEKLLCPRLLLIRVLLKYLYLETTEIEFVA